MENTEQKPKKIVNPAYANLDNTFINECLNILESGQPDA